MLFGYQCSSCCNVNARVDKLRYGINQMQRQAKLVSRKLSSENNKGDTVQFSNSEMEHATCEIRKKNKTKNFFVRSDSSRAGGTLGEG